MYQVPTSSNFVNNIANLINTCKFGNVDHSFRTLEFRTLKKSDNYYLLATFQSQLLFYKLTECFIHNVYKPNTYIQFNSCVHIYL